MDVHEELNSQKKFEGGRKVGVRWGSDRWGSGWWGVRVDVNAMLGVGGNVGYKKVLYNIKKIKKMWDGGGGAIFEPKTLSMYLKKKKKRKKQQHFFDRARIRSHDLRVRNSPG